jgi:putative ABC transport system permease protein
VKALLFALRSFARELRSGEVLVLLAAVGLAVGALTAVGFLTDRIGKAVARQANEVLAADMRLRSQEPMPGQWSALASEYDLETSETMYFPSVVFADEGRTLSGIKVVSENYPLRGAVRAYRRPARSGPTARCWRELVPMSAIRWALGSSISRYRQY